MHKPAKLMTKTDISASSWHHCQRNEGLKIQILWVSESVKMKKIECEGKL